jgi:hypothetical protein
VPTSVAEMALPSIALTFGLLTAGWGGVATGRRALPDQMSTFLEIAAEQRTPLASFFSMTHARYRPFLART